MPTRSAAPWPGSPWPGWWPATLASAGTLRYLLMSPVSRGRLLLVKYAATVLLGLSAIGLFICTVTDVPIGSMAATEVAAVISQVLDSLPQLDWLHPWLFSHYWLSFADLLRQPIAWDSFGQNALLQFGYVLVFGALAYGRLSTKDILS